MTCIQVFFLKLVLRNLMLRILCFERHLVDKLLHRFPFQANVLVNGGGVGFYQGDIRLLMDDLQTLRPTVFPVVPRLLNRICDKVRLR